MKNKIYSGEIKVIKPNYIVSYNNEVIWYDETLEKCIKYIKKILKIDKNIQKDDFKIYVEVKY